MKNIFKYVPKNNYKFILNSSENNIPEEKEDPQNVFPTLSVNLEYIKIKYNALINSDICIKEFKLTIKNVEYPAFLLFIDGMVDNDSINDFILEPLLLKNSILMKPKEVRVTSEKTVSIKKVQKFDLEDFIFSSLIPQNSIEKVTKFSDVLNKVNGGFCALFVDTLPVAFCAETRDIKGRSISEPQNESVIRGPHEAFIENIRTNTAMIRKIVNNENLIIEQSDVR